MDGDPQTPEAQVLAFLAEGGDGYTSGEILSGKLGLSRASIWKYVESLRARGYTIEALPARGYRLAAVPDRLSALELLPLLGTRELGQTLHAFDALPSTNAKAFALATEGAGHGEVVIAEEQTSGKGRRGRTWVSLPGKSLSMSVILRPELPPQRASELTLVTAVALAETLAEAGADVAIKWPNDVQIKGLKVAGILTELSAEPERVHFVVVGIGVNLNGLSTDFPRELSGQLTSLEAARGQKVSRALFTAALLAQLEDWYDRHATEGFAPVRQAWRDRASTLGRDVVVHLEQRQLHGRAEDIDQDGALLLRLPDGTLERVVAGDVEHLRPDAPAP